MSSSLIPDKFLFCMEFLVVSGVLNLLEACDFYSAFAAACCCVNCPHYLFLAFLVPMILPPDFGIIVLDLWNWLVPLLAPSMKSLISSFSSSLFSSPSFFSSSASPSLSFLFFLPLLSLPTFEIRRLLRPLPFLATEKFSKTLFSTYLK